MPGSITLRQLRTLMAVVECGGFAAAARSLGVSQPAISKQIGALERRLGYDLFIAAPGARPRLTPRGRRMVDGLPGVLEQFPGTAAEPRTLEATPRIVRVGCGDAIGERITECIPALYAAIENVSIELRTFDPSVSSVLKLEEDNIDLAYLTLRVPPSERIAERIGTVTSALYLPARLTGGRRWDPAQSLPVISAPDTSFLSRDFDQAVKHCGIRAHHVVARVITQRDRIRLALAGIGAVLSIDRAVEPFVASGQLRRIGSRGLTLHRCRFANPLRYGERDVRLVERFLTEALSAG